MKKAVINTNGVILDFYNDDETPYVPKNCEVVEISNTKASKVESNKPEKSCLVDNEIITMTEWFALRVAPVVPESVTNYQLRQALNESPDDRAAVEALVNESDDPNIKDGWEHASEFKSDNALFVGAVTYLGWSQEKVDDLLILASTFK